MTGPEIDAVLKDLKPPTDLDALPEYDKAFFNGLKESPLFAGVSAILMATAHDADLNTIRATAMVLAFVGYKIAQAETQGFNVTKGVAHAGTIQ